MLGPLKPVIMEADRILKEDFPFGEAQKEQGQGEESN